MAERVGHRHTAETAHGSIDDYYQTEYHKADHIRITGHSLKQLGTAHKLGYHRRREKQHDDNGGQIGQQIGLIAVTNHINDCYGVNLTGYNGHLLAEDSQYKK